MEFLPTGDADVLAVLRRQLSNATAAAELVRRSGWTPEECARWSYRFRCSQAISFATSDTDEGRRSAGLVTALLWVFYNSLLVPMVYWMDRRTRRRRGAG